MPKLLDPTLSVRDMIFEVSEGNPGALNVLMNLFKHTEKIDPDAAMGPIINILSLDDMDIWGPRVWMLYKDVCDEDIGKVCALLRATQLGFLSEEKLNHAIDNMGDGINIEDLIKKVEKRLPKFNINGVKDNLPA